MHCRRYERWKSLIQLSTRLLQVLFSGGQFLVLCCPGFIFFQQEGRHIFSQEYIPLPNKNESLWRNTWDIKPTVSKRPDTAVYEVILYWAQADPSIQRSLVWVLCCLGSQEASHHKGKVYCIAVGFILSKMNSQQNVWKFILIGKIFWLTGRQWLIANQYWQNWADSKTGVTSSF